MKEPVKFRNQIPFFCDKSSLDLKKDRYEHYDPMVIKQSMIHLSDRLWGEYPMQSIINYVTANGLEKSSKDILEIGCGVGRMIAELAMQYQQANCWGIDYSYQMLRQAKNIWIDGSDVSADYSRIGFNKEFVFDTESLQNLNFGLAKCEDLPFNNDSQDLVVSSFLIDRLEDPLKGLQEMHRVLRPDGRIVLVSPLNFNHEENWKLFFPASKFRLVLKSLDFNILDWNEAIKVKEPIDRSGNSVQWNCLGMVLGS